MGFQSRQKKLLFFFISSRPTTKPGRYVVCFILSIAKGSLFSITKDSQKTVWLHFEHFVTDSTPRKLALMKDAAINYKESSGCHC